MKKYVDFKNYPIKPVLKLLLTDKTTKQNIVFATKSYEYLGQRYCETCHIDEELLLGMKAMEIQPRVLKSIDEQADRTRKRAEVMTPAWLVNKMNNHCDEEWFGYPNAFNVENGEQWIVNECPVRFPENKSWQKYVDSMRLEITCGEAPYLVSRYDTTTGKTIPVKSRIGMLDRKLRVIGENTGTKEDWMKWTIRAFQSTYGYEYQGDNLLLARINLLITFVDYMENRWNEKPTVAELRKVANIIAWNIWQMDGLTGMVPFGKQEATYRQFSLFEFQNAEEEQVPILSRIYDWGANRSIIYNSLKE